MTVLVTGATDGIGRATAHALLADGHTVVVHGRPGDKLARVTEELRGAGTGIIPVAADLGELSQVATLADEVTTAAPVLDAVIHNAGVIRRSRETSTDGFELNFAVNHLAPLLLSIRLRSHLAGNAPARIVFVSSMVHESAEIDFADLQSAQGYDGMGAYGASKLANVYMTRVLAGEFGPDGITVNALHPGVINTKLLHAYFSGGAPVATGAETSVYLATSPNVAATTGRYFVGGRQRTTAALAPDRAEDARRLYEESIALIDSISTEFLR